MQCIWGTLLAKHIQMRLLMLFMSSRILFYFCRPTKSAFLWSTCITKRFGCCWNGYLKFAKPRASQMTKRSHIPSIFKKQASLQSQSVMQLFLIWTNNRMHLMKADNWLWYRDVLLFSSIKRWKLKGSTEDSDFSQNKSRKFCTWASKVVKGGFSEDFCSPLALISQ